MVQAAAPAMSGTTAAPARLSLPSRTVSAMRTAMAAATTAMSRAAQAVRPAPPRQSSPAATKDEDPGLVLISRRPPQQKFTSFEEYMNAHGGATAPIEDHSEEV